MKIQFDKLADKAASIHPLLAFPVVILWSWRDAYQIAKSMKKCSC